ncbi:MAG: hypothetical protein IRZ31_05320, partial [Thermogemmatispora sp.]|uniref:hypothetical protein n=1 Tax=Thermogemmatispora sp. TaxID=1968838 RepID=UPI0026091F9D
MADLQRWPAEMFFCCTWGGMVRAMSTIGQYQSGTEVQRFHLKRSAYVRNSLLALLTAVAFLLVAGGLVGGGRW